MDETRHCVDANQNLTNLPPKCRNLREHFGGRAALSPRAQLPHGREAAAAAENERINEALKGDSSTRFTPVDRVELGTVLTIIIDADLSSAAYALLPFFLCRHLFLEQPLLSEYVVF